MNRIKINLPDAFQFSTVIPIRITDLNYGGHVGNDSFLSLIHEARQQYLLSHGYKELSIAGIGLIMADVAIEFKKELNHGDLIKISVQAADFDKLGFDIFYKLEVINGNESSLAGKAKTGMICYDYAAKKKTTVPEEVIQKLQNG
jgi:YbgC/YbaW family acyl-CoA thioester hydrolase